MPKKYRAKKVNSQASSPMSSTAQAAPVSPSQAKGLTFKPTAVRTGAELMASAEKYAKRDILSSLIVGAVIFVLMIILYFIFR